ncbi:MAG: Gldg family protein [Planctomycetales bacterium]|nr:Gldg family protein [Planctomycetales bacterium]
MQIRSQVIRSIFKRNFASYFSGVLGYLFIIAFVVAGGALAFNARFFTANEPNLDQLSQWFPLLLLFIIPAITMSVWADEKRAGTDELLFTMPANDFEVLLGKYFSVLAVYSVALLFSMSHVLVLMFLGDPDWGLIVSTYAGYWFAGAALLSAGMVASVLANSAAVAFVIGVLLCGIPVFIGQLGAFIGLQSVFEDFSLREQFRDFGMGVIPLSGVAYFVAFTGFMLFLNIVFVKKRHWQSSRKSNMGLQFGLRVVAVGTMLSCATAWAGYTALRVDATSEQLFSLSDATQKIVGDLDAERPIEIQAFLSPEVPREYVDTRKQLVGLLRQFDELGGSKLEVRYVDVEPFSEQADEAKHFGIEPVRVLSERDGRRSEEDVYLGAVVISSYDKVVVPFFGKGLPIEYELTRSVQTVANKERLTVGVLTTDANVTGSNEWRIVSELKKQYHVEDVSPNSEIDGDKFDVLMAVLPSSLTDPQMDNLVTYVKAGKPALIFDDPFPLAFNNGFGVTNAPRQSKGSGGQMSMGGPPPEQKADSGRATRLTKALGIRWDYDSVAFDVNNPHPEFGMLPPEYIFVTRDGNANSFSTDSSITKGLQEIIAIYSGTVAPDSTADADFEFYPLITTTAKSGILRWNEFVDEGGFNFFSMTPTVNPKRNPFRRMDTNSHVLAAHLKSNKEGATVNAIFVSDIDMISNFFFEERNLGNLDLEFDNVTFVLNAVDSLAGDESFMELRSRRARHRTLKRVEAQKRVFLEEANRAELQSDADANAELAERREQLGKRLKEIEEDESLDPIAKAQMIKQAQEAEQQRLNLAEAQIEQRKNDDILKIRAETNRQIRNLESRIRGWAVWLPAIPASCLGAFVFITRAQAERRNVVDSRRRDRS